MITMLIKVEKFQKKYPFQKKFTKKTYNDFSYDNLIIEYHKNKMLSNKIIFPENYKKINLKLVLEMVNF